MCCPRCVLCSHVMLIVKFAVLCALQQCWAVIFDVLKYVLYIRYLLIPDVQYRVLRDVLLSFSSYFELCYNVLCCTGCCAVQCAVLDL